MKRKKVPCSLIVIAETETKKTRTPDKISLLEAPDRPLQPERRQGEANEHRIAVSRDKVAGGQIDSPEVSSPCSVATMDRARVLGPIPCGSQRCQVSAW